MSDAARELTDLKREVLETRNQAIKTDNQIKNLGLDVKGFEQRLAFLEKRTRLASVGVYLIIAVVVAGAAYVVDLMRSRAASDSMTRLRQEATAALERAKADAEALRAQLAVETQRRADHERHASIANKADEHLDAHREREAALALLELDMNKLTEIERRLLEKRFVDARRRAAEAAYRAAKTLAAAAKLDAVLAETDLSLKLDPEGRYAPQARYLAAVTLGQLKRYEEAIPAIRAVIEKGDEKSVLEEMQLLLGVALAQTGRKEEANQQLTKVISGGGRYAAAARTYVAAIESGEGLPQNAGRGSKPPPRRSTATETRPGPAAEPVAP